MADFVKAEHVGVTVSSLKDLGDVLANLSDDEYMTMQQNALRISTLTRSGHYLTTAVTKGLQ